MCDVFSDTVCRTLANLESPALFFPTEQFIKISRGIVR